MLITQACGGGSCCCLPASLAVLHPFLPQVVSTLYAHSITGSPAHPPCSLLTVKAAAAVPPGCGQSSDCCRSPSVPRFHLTVGRPGPQRAPGHLGPPPVQVQHASALRLSLAKPILSRRLGLPPKNPILSCTPQPCRRITAGETTFAPVVPSLLYAHAIHSWARSLLTSLPPATAPFNHQSRFDAPCRAVSQAAQPPSCRVTSEHF